jgi:hypothetical protein
MATQPATPHRRASDTFLARWSKRFAYALIPALLSGAGVLWADRAARLKSIADNTVALNIMTFRVTALEVRVEENKNLATQDRKEILDEIREMRKEVRAMYIRASAR